MRRAPDSQFELLVQRGVAGHRARRFLEEIEDHRLVLQHDLTQAGVAPREAAIEANRRMGDCEQLCELLAADPANISLARRRPLLMFLIAPLGIAPAVVGLYFLLSLGIVAGAIRGLGWSPYDDRVYLLTHLLFLPAAYLLHTSVALWFCLLARRYECAWRWPACACICIALAGLMLNIQYTIPSPIAEQAVLAVGTDVSYRLIRGLAPLIVLAACVIVDWRRHTPIATVSTVAPL